jgi:hypothetical protein
MPLILPSRPAPRDASQHQRDQAPIRQFKPRASREDTVVCAVVTSYGRVGNGHVPSITTKMGSRLVAARSDAVRDPPSIEICAPGQRLA